MKASMKIGVMTLMVLSIFSGVALADPPSGGDAGNTAYTSTYLSIPLSTEWTIFHGDHYNGDNDWYRPSTVYNNHLGYQIDQGDYSKGARLDAWMGPLINGNPSRYMGNTSGDFVVTSSDGSSYIDIYTSPSSLVMPYQFALRRY